MCVQPVCITATFSQGGHAKKDHLISKQIGTQIERAAIEGFNYMHTEGFSFRTVERRSCGGALLS